MLATLALGAFERVINDWIDLDAATRQGFDQLAGQLMRVVVDAPLLSVDVFFDQGRLRLSPTPVGMGQEPAHSVFEQRACDLALAPTKAQLTLHVPHLVALARLLGAAPDTIGNVPIDGDLSILQQVQHVMANAEPDIAHKLSPWIGDVLASQIAQLLSQGKTTLKRTTEAWRAHSAELLKEDSQLLAPRWQAERFIDGVRDLRQDVERLQARLKQFNSSAKAPDDQPPSPPDANP